MDASAVSFWSESHSFWQVPVISTALFCVLFLSFFFPFSSTKLNSSKELEVDLLNTLEHTFL